MSWFVGRLTIVGGDRGRWSRAAPKNRGNITVWTARVRVQSPDRTRRFAAVLVSWSAEELGEPIVVRIRHATVRLGASCYCPRVEARGDQYRFANLSNSENTAHRRYTSWPPPPSCQSHNPALAGQYVPVPGGTGGPIANRSRYAASAAFVTIA